MKKIIFFALLLISLKGFGQADTTVQPPSQDTPLFTVSDYNRFYDEVLKSMPMELGNKIQSWWQKLYAQKEQQWMEEKRKALKPKSK
jgi:hypothetical protein